MALAGSGKIITNQDAAEATLPFTSGGEG